MAAGDIQSGGGLLTAESSVATLVRRNGVGSRAHRIRYVTQSIEDIATNDHVVSRDQNSPNGPLVLGRVDRVYKRLADHLRILTIRDFAGVEQILRTTDEHPFHGDGRRWTKAKDLRVADVLFGPQGPCGILIATSREEHPEGIWVYNLRVAATHTYFVREQGLEAEPIWVHNANYQTVSGDALDELRSEFNSTVRSKFVKYYATTEEAAEIFSAEELAVMKKYGITPDGYYVHHQQPLFRGGDNSFENLDLLSWEEHYGNGNFKRLHYYEPGQNPYGRN